MNSAFVVIIPARYGSTRLPGKPLLQIDGSPMIQLVHAQAARSSARQVLVATDDSRIADAVHGFGGEAMLTSAQHVSGTDRLAEVVNRLELDDDAVVVNVQGDEPHIPPQVIDQVASNLLERAEFDAATLCVPITTLDEFEDPSAVKVVFDATGRALYFSRAAIPWPRDAFAAVPRKFPAALAAYRHVGIYAYRVGLLRQFVQWSVAPGEAAESLEQLRILHQGGSIHVEIACVPVPGGVDTEQDLRRLRGAP